MTKKSTAVATPEPELATEALTLKKRALALVIIDQQSYDKAVNLRLLLTDFIKAAKATHKGAIDAAKDSLAQAKKLLSDLTDGPEEALKVLNARIPVYDREQREAKRRRLQAAQAEAQRQAEDDQLELAQTVADAGLPDIAGQIINAPVKAAPVRIEPTFVPSTDLGTRDVWSGACDSLAALVRAVCLLPADAPLDLRLLEFLEINQTRLNKESRDEHNKMNVPGCRAVNNPVPVAKGSR